MSANLAILIGIASFAMAGFLGYVLSYLGVSLTKRIIILMVIALAVLLGGALLKTKS